MKVTRVNDLSPDCRQWSSEWLAENYWLACVAEADGLPSNRQELADECYRRFVVGLEEQREAEYLRILSREGRAP